MASARALDRRRPLAWAAAVALVALSALQFAAASVGDTRHRPAAPRP